jgi:hypothetical protein
MESAQVDFRQACVNRCGMRLLEERVAVVAAGNARYEI